VFFDDRKAWELSLLLNNLINTVALSNEIKSGSWPATPQVLSSTFMASETIRRRATTSTNTRDGKEEEDTTL
jgi:hypothetical protein